MILDKYISYDKKVIISAICAGIWIYFRTAECYALLPRKSLFSVVLIMFWVYVNYYEPLSCLIGVFILIMYTKYNHISNFQLNKNK